MNFADPALATLDANIEAAVGVAMLFWPAFCADPANAGALEALRSAYAEGVLQSKAKALAETIIYQRPA